MLTGHLVSRCPIRWQSDSETWHIGDVVIATTMKVYDRVSPSDTSGFEGFVEAVLNPLFDLGEHNSVEPGADSDGDELTVQRCDEAQQHDVERVLLERKRNGVVQYKVKWK